MVCIPLELANGICYASPNPASINALLTSSSQQLRVSHIIYRSTRSNMNHRAYQTLIIKDARRVNQCWKWSIVLIQLGIVITGLTVTFSFHALLENYNSNCISGVDLVYVHRDDVANATGEPLMAESESLQHQCSNHNYSDQLRIHFEDRFGKIQRSGLAKSKAQDESPKGQQILLNDEDMEFFETQKIDEINTFWHSKTPCDYFSFVPLLESIVAIVWLALFIMCGNGGRSSETFVDEPWRIVPPAFAFFVLMILVSAVYLCLLITRLDGFCNELKSNFHDQTIPCALLINQFSLSGNCGVQPSHNYVLTITYTWLTLGLWTLSAGVMAARCYLGIDFEAIGSNGPCPDGEKQNAGLVCSINEKIHVDDGDDDDEYDVDELEEDTVEVVMHLNGKSMKLSKDRLNRFVDTIEEEQELNDMSTSTPPSRIRLVNEVCRPKIPKTARLKSYN